MTKKAKKTAAKGGAPKIAKAPPATKSARPKKPARIINIAGQPTRYLREIKLDRVIMRREMGDLAGLAKSIDERGGLISPVCITPANELIAGQRRLAAWSLSEKFHKEPIPVNVLDVDNILAGEWDENKQRKDFTPSEAVELMEALAPMAAAKAKERQAHGKTGPGKPKEVVEGADASGAAEGKGAASDHLARYLGRDRKTLTRAQEVINAAKAEPENEEITKLVVYMDKTGKVNGPFKRLQRLLQSADIASKKASGKLDLPEGKFDRIVADMPWAFEPGDDRPQSATRGVRPYATMSTKQMCAMAGDVKARAGDNCVLFFWTTNYHLSIAYEVLRAWGFSKYPTVLSWVKQKDGAVQIGRGQWLRDASEHCIIAIKGKPAWMLDAQSTVLFAARRENSQKPDEFYALMDVLAPAQRSLELFARRELPEGWQGFGDQVGTLKTESADEPKRKRRSKQIDLEEAIAGANDEIVEAAALPADEAVPHYYEQGALEAVESDQPLPGDVIAKLKAEKLVRGSVKPKLTKLGIARLIVLRRPVESAPPEPTQAQTVSVNCRVCGDGTGLCAQCLPAEEHVIAMTREMDEAGEQELSVATCQCCNWTSKFSVDRHRNQDAAVKAHWREVVAANKVAVEPLKELEAAE